MTPDTDDYVLGTHAAEVHRLGVQHEVWRPHAMRAWKSAGFARGQTVLDVGCGPGHATLDLANVVGPDGRVVAIDRAHAFLAHLERVANGRGLGNVQIIEANLDDLLLEPETCDGAWCRWVLSFVSRPRDVLERVVSAVKPGGALVFHEYFDYATWRALPPSPAFTEFVERVMASWRDSGGEPDIALQIPSWLEELGCEIERLEPLVFVVQQTDPMWQWPAGFMEIGLERLRDLGIVSSARATELWQALTEVLAAPATRVATPAVLEIIARKR